MKLSDIRGEQVIETVAEIIEPIANIASSEAGKSLFTRVKLPEGADPRDFVVGRIKKQIPALLRENKDDIVTILAAVNGTPRAEYAESLTLIGLLGDVTDLLSDPAFRTLFFSARSGTPSSSAPENTGEQ